MKTQTHFIIGPGIIFDKERTQKLYAKNGHTFVVHGDGRSAVDLSKIDLSEAVNIIIDAYDYNFCDAFSSA